MAKCDKIPVEAVVKIINVNYEKGAQLLQKCKTMQEYSLFIQMVRERFKETGDRETAVRESIRECIRTDVLAEYLERQKGDIMSILEVNLTLEERDAIREMDGYVRGKEEGLAEGLEEGRSAGALEKSREIAKNLKAAGLDVKMIADNTGLTIEEIEDL